MNRPLAVLTVIAIFAGFFALYSVLGASSNRIETDSLQGDIDEIRSTLETLRWDNETDSLQGDIDEIRSNLEALQGDVDETRSNLEALRWDIEEVRSTLESLEWRIQ